MYLQDGLNLFGKEISTETAIADIVSRWNSDVCILPIYVLVASDQSSQFPSTIITFQNDNFVITYLRGRISLQESACARRLLAINLKLVVLAYAFSLLFHR